jgi:hypothetical protein
MRQEEPKSPIISQNLEIKTVENLMTSRILNAVFEGGSEIFVHVILPRFFDRDKSYSGKTAIFHARKMHESRHEILEFAR